VPHYQELFAKDSVVRVKERTVLESFQKAWRHHNPLNDGQLAHAGKKARVVSIGFYHGGDVLYSLEGAPGVWHEECLELPRDEPKA
jgi:hypothetical protein